jgi:hypothetical protein
MNELDLIIKYLQLRGSKVVDYLYYVEYIIMSSAEFTAGLGTVVKQLAKETQGRAVQDVYFFGNITVAGSLAGVITLAGQNEFNFGFISRLKGRTEAGYISTSLMVADNLYKDGAGVYRGNRRIYGVGCNELQCQAVGITAGVPTVQIELNGIIFIMK